MKRCPVCHSLNDNSARFCSQCGAPLDGPSSPQASGSYQASPPPPQGYSQPRYPPQAPQGYAQYVTPKSEFVAVLLSFFIPGVGQMYAGAPLKGVAFLLAGPSLMLLAVIAMFISPSMSYLSGIYILMVIIYFWNIIDAYLSAKNYNQKFFPYGYQGYR